MLHKINETYGTRFAMDEEIPPFIKSLYSSNVQPSSKLCDFIKSALILIKKPQKYQHIDKPLPRVNKTYEPILYPLKPVDNTSLPEDKSYKYPFESEKDLKNYLEYSDIIENIYRRVIDGDDELLKDTYLPVKQSDGRKIYNSSVKIFKNGPSEIVDRSIIDASKDRNDDASRKNMLCKKQFADAMTTFINSKKFFNDTEAKIKNIARYQYLMNCFFTKIRNLYVNENSLNQDDVIFMYKGGTTMKILYNEYYNVIDKFDIFREQIKSFFERSDSDYTYLINPNIPNFDKLYYHFSKIAILGLCHIKNMFIENKNFFINMNEVTDDDMYGILNDFNKKLEGIRSLYNNETATIKDPAMSQEYEQLIKTMNCDDILKVDKFIGISFSADNELRGGGIDDYLVDPKLNSRYVFTENIPDGFKKINIGIEDEDNGLYRKPLQNRTPREPSEGMIKSATFLKYKAIASTRKSFYITKTNPMTTGNMYIGDLECSENNWYSIDNFYVTANETIFFTGPKGNQVSFMLTRMKYNFIIYFRSGEKYGYFNVPSEIADLSMSKQLAYDLNATFAGLRKKISIYEYVYNPSDLVNSLTITYNGLSILGFINDFMKILFYEFDVPWKADKYKKRTYRLLFFIYIELLSKNKLHLVNKLIQYFNALLPEDYSYLISELSGLGAEEFINLYEERVARKIRNDEVDENGTLYENLTAYIELKNNVLIKTLTEFKEKYDPMTKLEVETSSEGKIKVHQLGGYNKYIKYVNKINNLSNLISKRM